MTELEQAVDDAEKELDVLRRRLTLETARLHDYDRREREAVRTLPVARKQLDFAIRRAPELLERLKVAKAERAERDRIAAENTSSCGCC